MREQGLSFSCCGATTVYGMWASFDTRLWGKLSHWSLCSYELICSRCSSPIRAAALPEILRKISEEKFLLGDMLILENNMNEVIFNSNTCDRLQALGRREK